ncbi:unnamed protein product, partial [Meganyctiphanes norvegica]
MVGEMWRESALISSKWSLSSYVLVARVYLLFLCVTTSVRSHERIALGSDGIPIAEEHNFIILNPEDGTYSFAYDTGAGDDQSFRMEVRDASGRVSGRFGYIDPDGALRITNYNADASGYRSSMTVFERASQKPKGPALVVGPVPNELPPLDSIEPGSRSTNRGRPENVLPPEGIPLLIIGPLPRELQPREILEIDFPEVIPGEEDAFLEVGQDEFLVPTEVNNGSPVTIENKFSFSNSSQSSQFDINLSLASRSEESLLNEDVSIQELQSNKLLISEETTNGAQLFELPIHNPISNSAQFDSNIVRLSLLNENVRSFIDSASQSDLLFSTAPNEKDVNIDNRDIKDISQLHTTPVVVGEDTLQTEQLHLESRIISRPIEAIELAATELNSNTFKLSSRVSGSTKLIQIVRNTMVPLSKNSQGHRFTSREAQTDVRIVDTDQSVDLQETQIQEEEEDVMIEKTDVSGYCCNITDTKKASSEQVVVNLPQPNYLPPINKQTQDKKTYGDNSFLSHRNAYNSNNMKSIILRALLLPNIRSSLLNQAHLESQPSSHRFR